MSGQFVISLDFELLWGVRDHSDKQSYGQNVLGARKAVPRILDLFAMHGISATWATVGFLFCESKEELMASLPLERPDYTNSRLSNYTYLNEVGKDERTDPYYLAGSLVEAIRQTPRQEIATHTMSHYYCLEDGQTEAAFRADLVAAKRLASQHHIALKSIVFPRNQFSDAHLAICAQEGITHYRGNQTNFAYRTAKSADQTWIKRGVRIVDAYSGILGSQTFGPTRKDPMDVAASRFLRPFSGTLAALRPLHISTIQRGMTAAAKAGRGYHLWWHPHNFGRNLDANMIGLQTIIDHFLELGSRFGMRSCAMKDV